MSSAMMKAQQALGAAPDASPMVVMEAIQRISLELEEVTRELAEWIQIEADSRISYTREFERALVELVGNYEGQRLPGEEVRRALVHQQLSDDLIGHWLTAKTKLRQLEATSSGLSKSLSGLQSLLRTLRDEVSTYA